MAEKGKIKANIGNLLTYVGQLYDNPKDALKEYVSNDIDEWLQARTFGKHNGPCKVCILLTPSRVLIRSYSQPGKDRDGLKKMMREVAQSIKPTLGVPQIGRLAIGLFAFNQIGNKAVFYSKPEDGKPTWKLTLTKGSEDYEIEEAPKREHLGTPGFHVVITGLAQDPTRPRAALSPGALAKYLAERFDYYLRGGMLELTIEAKGQQWRVEPPPIRLSPIAEGFKDIYIKGDPAKPLQCMLWFDPSSQGRITISHTGIPIIEDMRRIDEIHPGFGETIYCSGYLKGVINADFLTPLPARRGFAIDAGWMAFMAWLESVEPSIRTEVEEHRLEEDIQRIQEVQDKAKRIAEEIFETEPWQEMELLGGMRRKRGKRKRKKRNPRGTETGERAKQKSGSNPDPKGLRFSFKEVPLEDPWRHSTFEAGTLKVNTRNPNYVQRVLKGTKIQATRYIALLIGKETAAFNDKTGKADYYLEKLLAFQFALESRQ